MLCMLFLGDDGLRGWNEFVQQKESIIGNEFERWIRCSDSGMGKVQGISNREF